MKPYFEDNLVRIYNKDCRAMDELPDNSVQCVVTSPPYWGLRKYSGLQDLIWGGDKGCVHEGGNAEIKELNYVQGNPEFARPHREHKSFKSETNTCSRCDAWKGAYGLEPTPEMYIQHTIEILREIRRVLRKDGVVFWNIGDSYHGGNRGQWDGDAQRFHGLNREYTALDSSPNRLPQTNLKPKDLCLIPFKVAIAVQSDGWWVRSVIIWSKPNPMPESVTDRPTESHEYILLLTKSARYYWDADAVREPHLEPERSGKRENMWSPNVSKDEQLVKGGYGRGKYTQRIYNPAGRNIRTVWEFPTQPYPDAHFAIFPEKLPEICIKAATPEVGCCGKCGAPWERIRKPTQEYSRALERLRKVKDRFTRPAGDWHSQHAEDDNQVAQYKTIGWQPTCKCNADKVPSLVLDPFMGSGTTLWVAKKLGRRGIGYELSEEYCQLALERNRQSVMELKV